ncbi:helix-turn-helix transcriptional regulator [Candidatus Halobonum tyrrellensis]|uniref:IclR-like transcriptional regulator n=1 Tax=Candidatus Halobonum tyrrellensis G22 TaxID=1324957 RepID=V4HDS3_9EURY|nr:transcriptional regulator [Candidatus Halobonum tyrrellensis]ESP88795.1 IclR-like transcriptional regulator [Candidatus Halobonum tyrrellensis G22]
MNDDDITEVVKRGPMLERLADGPVGSGDLERDLSASRSTIHRVLDRMGDLGVVSRCEQGYELTQMGRLVATRVASVRRELRAIGRAEPFFRDATLDGVDLPLDLLADATVVEPPAGRAHFTVKRVSDLMADAESMRMFSTVVSPLYVDLCVRHAKRGADIEAIFDRAVVDTLFSEYGSESREAAAEGGLCVRAHDCCPFELFVFDRTVGMTAHDDAGVSHAFVELDGEAAVAWATDLFERYAADAEYVTLF